MGNYSRCINGTLEDTKYSSPVPFIGLYTAAASAVCLLFMLCDIIAGFRARKRWLPCKLLPLNSVTLTLLSIAAKIPVDLTTAMPSYQDQLSKLSGTTLIFIAMGFFMPSLCDRKRLQWESNMAALSIFVITVVVNICIQISTGVIFLFVAEHIIIVCCMLLLLVRLWWFCVYFNDTEKDSKYQWRRGSMFEQLKKCYALEYQYSSQYRMCRDSDCAGLSGLCLLSCIILIQAAVRSVILKQIELCSGSSSSDYGWSMSVIVFTQILTVIVGNSAISFRWLSMYQVVDLFDAGSWLSTFWVIRTVYDLHYSILIASRFVLPPYFLLQLFWVIPKTVMYAFGYLASYPISLITFKGGTMEQYQGGDEWIVRKRVAKMERITAAHTGPGTGTGVMPFNHLLGLHSRTCPSTKYQLRDEANPNQQGSEMSFIHMVYLVGLARVSLPDSLSASLVHAFDEVCLIFQFIHTQLNPESFHYYQKHLKEGKLAHVFDRVVAIANSIAYDEEEPQHDLNRVTFIISGLKRLLDERDFFKKEVAFISDFIHQRGYSSLEDVYASMEQLFVDITHALFAQLPRAILRSLGDERVENLEANIPMALSMLCKVVSLEDKFEWSFPEWSNMTSLISEEPQSRPEEEDKVAGDVDPVAEDVNINDPNDNDNVIVPIE